MGVVYSDPEPEIEPALRETILENAGEDDRQKPWGLVEIVAQDPEFTEDETRTALKQLMLDGELQITASGEVRATSGSA